METNSKWTISMLPYHNFLIPIFYLELHMYLYICVLFRNGANCLEFSVQSYKLFHNQWINRLRFFPLVFLSVFVLFRKQKGHITESRAHTHTYIHKNWDGIRDRNVNAWHFCENIVSWCDTLVLFVSIRFFPSLCFCRFIFILIQKLLHRMAAWETGLLSLSMILFCCSIGEKMNWKQYCINFCLHLLCVIICATTTKTTITSNRTSFHLIIYFSFRRPTSHYALTNNSLCVYVYEIFTLTFAFVSRWYYFFVFSSLFLLRFTMFYISSAHFFHLSSWFRFAQSFLVYSFSVVSQSFFSMSLELECYGVSCSVIRVSCSGEYCISLGIEKKTCYPKKAHTKNEIGKERKKTE